MRRFDVMKQWSNGFVAAIGAIEGERPDANEHWKAGYLAGYRMRREKSRLLDEYLVSTGREPQAVISICQSSQPSEVRDE